eukprot:CFRG7847T1
MGKSGVNNMRVYSFFLVFAIASVIKGSAFEKQGAGADECDVLECRQTVEPFCSIDKNSVYETFANDCLLAVAQCSQDARGIKTAHPGECTEDELKQTLCIQRSCKRILAPVCGSDGETYSNDCLLKVAACDNPITKAYDGHCDHIQNSTTADIINPNDDIEDYCTNNVCTKTFNPVCGSNGVSYRNECILQHKSKCNSFSGEEIKIIHSGRCAADVVGLDQCYHDNNCLHGLGTTTDPVCVNTGETFANECLVKLTICLRGVSILRLHKGKCEPENIKGSVCEASTCGKSKSDQKICAGNGLETKLFTDDCELHVHGCRLNLAYVPYPMSNCLPDMPTATTVLTETQQMPNTDDATNSTKTISHDEKTDESNKTSVIYNIVAVSIIIALVVALAYAIRSSIHYRRQKQRAFRFIDLDMGMELENGMESNISPPPFHTSTADDFNSDDDAELLDDDLNG